MSSFFKQYDDIINEYHTTRDNNKLLTSMESLLNVVSTSVDDAMFTTSHNTLKSSINKIIESTKLKLQVIE